MIHTGVVSTGSPRSALMNRSARDMPQLYYGLVVDAGCGLHVSVMSGGPSAAMPKPEPGIGSIADVVGGTDDPDEHEPPSSSTPSNPKYRRATMRMRSRVTFSAS